ncbi:DNA-protecting protein DprA [Pantoea sp. EKM101V]|uniref:DNA-protecting protein DprA n=1 Tax=Pantoea sp. EKM101V TaxID=1683695 RepID=UPI00142E3103|nr:DNA-protecting protein DprA [Pantoea sp. EKM101V]KAF6664156.1 DNA-protecting protein DprA [Pantoea sp. EKM101V]
MDKIAQYLRLAAVCGMTGKRWLTVAQQLGDAPADSGKLMRLGLDAVQCQQYADLPEKTITDVQHWLARSPAHHLITALDAAYPARLRETSRFPPLLYIHGDPAVITTPQLAVVGSRNGSPNGRYWGEWFTRHLSLSGLTITSGLARGIDGVAHQAALSTGGKTVAILGSGLQRLYPRQHVRLAAEIVEQGGAVVSEFPLNTIPHPLNFPRRNRIISGLSLGVLVVEASLKSGSLVTARYALEQNRNIYALPGALGNPLSEGVNWLIQQGALLVAHPNNILEDLAGALNWLPVTQDDEIYSEPGDDAPLPFADVLANVGDEVTPVDVVAERAGQSVPVISAQLLELELAGWIAAVPGGYVRLRRACHVRRTHVLV